jgi:hypothetical protein
VKVFIYASGQDTGGQGHRIEDAFRRYTDWQVDAMSSAPSSLGYPETSVVHGAMRTVAARQLYAGADVVHLRNTLKPWEQFDRGMAKPIVLHFHGTQFREGHGGLSRQAQAVGAVQIVSTLDLALLEPDLTWLPSPYDLADLAAQKQPRTERIRIAHFPTSARVKSTDAFLAAAGRLAARYPIDIVTNVHQGRIRHMQWSEVMAQKATADIYFDQVILGYGNNAIEAWGMGIPVVAGAEDPAVRALMVERFGRLPFVEATEQTIEQALERLIQSEQMRAEYSAIGLAHVQRFHDDRVVVAQLQDIYAAAPPSRIVVLPHASPGWVARKEAARQRRQERMDTRLRLRAERMAAA